MFKIGELKDTTNEKIIVKSNKIKCQNYRTNEISYYHNLSFKIEGKLDNDEYSIYFELDNDINNLLLFRKLEKVNVNKYIRDCYFNFNNENGIEPEINVFIARYLQNKFNVIVYFISQANDNNSFEDKYSGLIEFDFNLDDYLGENDETN